MKRLSRVLLLAAVGLAAPAHALRCDGELVTEGDHAFQVQRRCGEPDMTRQWVVYRAVSLIPGTVPLRDEVIVPVVVEEWLYNFGPHRFERLLRFENGRLTDIETLGYGN